MSLKYLIILSIFIFGCKKNDVGLIKVISAISKGGGTTSSPVVIPLTNAVIIGDGNSLTYGYLASNPATKNYISQLALLSPFVSNGSSFSNFGVTAQTTQNMIDDAVSQIDPLFNGSVTNILCGWEGGNDIYFNGDASAAHTRYVAYMQARQAAGFYTLAFTCPPRDQSTTFGDNSAQFNTKLDTFNSLVRANWASYADALVDVAADSRFSGYNLTYYNADKVHYTDTGYGVVADLVKTAILTFTNN